MSGESKPLVSVVTPVKNGERYLSETIESVMGQTLTQWEYIIVDGCSDDGTLKIAREYSEQDSRITVISEPDSGLYDALFKGFERSSAPVCCWLNADDKYMPWAFDLALKYMEVMGASWITGVPAFYDEKGLLSHIRGPFWYPRTFIRMGLFHGRCMGFIQQESTFFSRDLLEKIDGKTIEKIRGQKVVGDFLMWKEFSRHAPLHTLPSVISGFRRHSNNLTRDMNLYYDELIKAGCYVPRNVFIGKIMRSVMRPLSFYKIRNIQKKWVNSH